MDDLDKIFCHIKTLTNKRFFGKVNLIFESGQLVHSEITQKLKPDALIVREKITITTGST